MRSLSLTVGRRSQNVTKCDHPEADFIANRMFLLRFAWQAQCFRSVSMLARRFLVAGAALCARHFQFHGRRSILSRGEGAALMNRSGRAESSRVVALQFSHGAFRFVDSVVFFTVRSCSGDAWATRDDFYLVKMVGTDASVMASLASMAMQSLRAVAVEDHTVSVEVDATWFRVRIFRDCCTFGCMFTVVFTATLQIRTNPKFTSVRAILARQHANIFVVYVFSVFSRPIVNRLRILSLRSLNSALGISKLGDHRCRNFIYAGHVPTSTTARGGGPSFKGRKPII